MGKNIIRHSYKIDIQERRRANKHSSFMMLFTGLSGSGKSTIANALEQKLFDHTIKTYILDGDNIRDGINKDLTFQPKDRTENIRRIAELGKLFIDAGIVVLAAFVSPYEKDREFIKKTVGEDNFVEVFVNTPLEVCEARDVKGLYKKARKGEIKNMTGISAPYEAPSDPDIIVTDQHSVMEAVDLIYSKIEKKLKLKSNE
jgi:adenylylsulfate kinase